MKLYSYITEMFLMFFPLQNDYEREKKWLLKNEKRNAIHLLVYGP